MSSLPSVIAICLGACVGALARWRLGLWLSAPGSLLPWGTLAANWIGAYAIGLSLAFFNAQPHIDPVWRLAIVTGLLGALTTFSTFSAEVVTLLQQGRLVLASGVASLHLVGSLLLTWLGLRTAALWLTPA
ncbi:protein CrcB [Hydrogenophaga sp. Root209]|uniref:fluoride efflux transporter CrcB n=1 Tax=unclassified Hydrogenophaga TaxID=2610897 RepID=UPI0006F1C75E|nr:protein CrcB [Hydrogenophaga sp. Root209]